MSIAWVLGVGSGQTEVGLVQAWPGRQIGCLGSSNRLIEPALVDSRGWLLSLIPNFSASHQAELPRGLLAIHSLRVDRSLQLDAGGIQSCLPTCASLRVA